jgi:hypothetical protein
VDGLAIETLQGPVSATSSQGVEASGSVNGMVQVHQTLGEAVDEMLAGLCGMIDVYVAFQRNVLARFPESSSTAAVAFGARLDQLEAMARDGARLLR